MICLPCREAGQLNQLANADPANTWREATYQIARDYHGRCPGGCDCQHITGVVVINERGTK